MPRDHSEGSVARPLSPDSITGIIAQTRAHLADVERGLETIIRRLSPANNSNKNITETAKIEQDGIINQTQSLRALASRLVDQCTTLDNML